MKRSDKVLISGIAAVLIAGVVFAASFGVAVQRRNAARANFGLPPGSMALSEEPASADAGAQGVSDGPRARGEDAAPARRRIASFADLFSKTVFTRNDPHWGELLDSLKYPRSEWPEGVADRLHPLVTMIGPLFEDIRALAARGGPVQALDFSKGYAIDLSHVKAMDNLARLMHADAIVAADLGDVGRVVDDILTTMQLGDALAPEPVLYSHMRRFEIYEVAHRALTLLRSDVLAQEHYDRLMQHMAQGGRREEFAECFAGQAAMVQVALQHPADIAQPFPESLSPRAMLQYGYARAYASPLGRPLTYSDEAAALAILARMRDAARLPYHANRQEELAIERTCQNISWRHLFSRSNLTGTWSYRLQARHEALLGLARLGLAAERFRREYGAFPQYLDELADQFPEGLPVDPFTGEPYTYHVSDDAITLYSVGDNLRDDNGRHHLNNGDIVWRGISEEPN